MLEDYFFKAGARLIKLTALVQTKTNVVGFSILDVCVACHEHMTADSTGSWQDHLTDFRSSMAQSEKLRTEIERNLQAFFAEKLDQATQERSASVPLVRAVAEFTLRPGKRIRPLMLIAGYGAITGVIDDPRLHRAALTLELLQSYLLIQDDWMDGDELRRGGPTVHRTMRQSYSDQQVADSVAILIADFASAMAEELLMSSGFDADASARAMRAYYKIHQDVITGQYLDVTETGSIDMVHQLKTASYTVTGPIMIGAELAMASPEQIKALEVFGNKVGLAFQLKDDLIGTFGKSKSTGKASDNDIKSGKRTALLEALRQKLDESERKKLEELLGQEHMSKDEVEFVRQMMLEKGAKQTIEARAAILTKEALAALQEGQWDSAGSTLLGELSEMLLRRDN